MTDFRCYDLQVASLRLHLCNLPSVSVLFWLISISRYVLSRGSRAEGRGSRVEGRGSRVEGRGSRVKSYINPVAPERSKEE